jgi:GTP cyclohydrolase IA
MDKNLNRQDLVRRLLDTIEPGQADREGLADTPRRVDAAYDKLFGGYGLDPADLATTFDGEGYDQMILVKDIELYSTCEHHMLPFFGKVHIGYIPNGKIIGLSKLPRLVEIFARRLQNQERLTMQIADAMMEVLQPKGVAVVVEAQHFCMMARGVEKQKSSATTSALRGLFKKDARTRDEFLRLIK